MIQQLESEEKSNIFGIFSKNDTEYIKFDPNELGKMVQFISDKGRVSVGEMVSKISDITQ